jgi:hypothetical protein
MAAPSADDVQQHVCYELKWMLRAVVRFEELGPSGDDDDDRIALQDSALLHARNLIEFAAAAGDDGPGWALSDIPGAKRRKVPARLSTFLAEANALGATDVRWPKDIEGNNIDESDEDRLSRVAEVVLRLLRPKHRTTTLETEAGAAYVELLDRARDYYALRTPDALAELRCSPATTPR